MLAFNVDTNQSVEIPESWVAGGTHILIGMQSAVLDYCASLREELLRDHFQEDTAKVESIKWLEGGKVVVGFGRA